MLFYNVLLLCLVAYVTCQNYETVGMTYEFYQTGEINHCFNTSSCHSYFESLRNRTDLMYVCFDDDNDPSERCEFNQTIDDDTTYVSFCVSFTSSIDPHKEFQFNINEDTIQADNFLNSINTQCENRRKYNNDLFCIF